MTKERTRPELTGDEKHQLLGWLELQRRVVIHKCDGLTEEQAHQAVLPSSPLMTMAGLVSHLRAVEKLWFETVFLGGARDQSPEGADWLVDEVPIAQVVTDYEAQCLVTDQVVAAHDLGAVAQHPDFEKSRGSLRWILTHMLEETARHAGHADILRELLDGDRGYYRTGQV